MLLKPESDKHGVARPKWEALLPKPQAGTHRSSGKSDRRGRSTVHALTAINELRERGVKVVSLAENFNLNTKDGRFVFAVLPRPAEYELELRAERQTEGIAPAERRQAEGTMRYKPVTQTPRVGWGERNH
ncbi:recombinase family protein [Nonomuraea angiospora]|uniref:recombinase family protein n=1 Tax=Nonomuraea angiospora TaxID=46172 RepID=UPI00344109BB